MVTPNELRQALEWMHRSRHLHLDAGCTTHMMTAWILEHADQLKQTPEDAPAIALAFKLLLLGRVVNPALLDLSHVVKEAKAAKQRALAILEAIRKETAHRREVEAAAARAEAERNDVMKRLRESLPEIPPDLPEKIRSVLQSRLSHAFADPDQVDQARAFVEGWPAMLQRATEYAACDAKSIDVYAADVVGGRITVAEACAKRAAEAARQKEMAERRLIECVNEIVPREFSEPFDPAKSPNPDAYWKVQKWDYDSGRNLFAFGPSGSGKTRAVSHRLRDLILSEHLGPAPSVEVWTGAKLGEQLGSYKDRDKLIAKLEQAHILFIDDVGFMRITEANQGPLFGIIDTRSKRHLPLVITSMRGVNTVAKSIGGTKFEDCAIAIVRRLHQDEKAAFVNFKAGHRDHPG